MLNEAALPLLTDAEDKHKPAQAGALSRLHFDLLESEQGQRVALAAESAAIEMMRE